MKKLNCIINSKYIKSKLTHVTNGENSKKIFKEGFKIPNNSPFMKPKALWISLNNGWEEWIEGEGGTIGCHILNIKLKPNLKLWKIDSFKSFMELWSRYTSKSPDLNSLDGKFWEWLKDKIKLDGIILTKKGENETRYTTWLYGWDCSCIAIFNPANVMIKK